MGRKYSAVVIGLGIVGSATLWRLSTRQTNILGIDAGAPINRLGSSYGGSRIFRQAYWEGTQYLPLLSQANDFWQELEASCDHPLLWRSGGLFIGSQSSGVVPKSAATARAGGIDYQQLNARQITQMFPAFRVPPDMEGIVEEGAYTIAADASRLHMLNLAVRSGAQIRFGSQVLEIHRSEGRLLIRLADGETVETERVVLATGSTLTDSLIPDLAGLLRPKSVPIYWFKPKPGSADSFKNFPAFLYERSDSRLLYGTPQITETEPGIKIGFHNSQQTDLDMDTHLEPVSRSAREEIADCVAALFPSLDPTPYAAKKCIYTMSPDESFILGESTQLPGVFYVSACSGHGFKFATGLGEWLSLAILGESLQHIAPAFSRARFDKTG
ncbi:N-methyl-L-tryptophan oxidase [Pseudomonas fluorescens]|uniref:N-methyl-L-tryptophan oxidase n=1 Tax=Pseudomonas fluorescens TaxID=294 RepID=A0A944HE43_PSEFL|nr:N-methyl-L-tryptophan oxidase [Pseudomonas fluorescens]MBT2306675.1 N-methyl-L-tryptophan oxidase [Pseudomonas fluorescens]MBT2316415.1 N-methyl-L-tryptophan oxidase [Pseudomonas fluorescens]MBT2330207.1 N-methyl-L-tryptophan oxidase [Pseudomonas fluorescens]MBT2342920.1 N-methyl-L-tryptophan oxidase [Pseudomonas fluorescens]